MPQHSTLHLATVIALPIVTVILLWTLIIYHKNRKAWQSYDIPIVAIVYISTIRNISIGVYIAFRALDYAELIRNSCSVFIWLLNSLHTFQATCLTTLAVIGLFSIKLYGKRRSLKLYLTPSHVIYHLFCLTALCACVGIAALLAQGDQFLLKECRFMPYDLDVKFNVFIIVLHLFLLITSTSATITVALYYCKLRAKYGFDYLKKSTSDLSDLSSFDNSVDNKLVHGDGKGFYDTYTIQRTGGNQYNGDQNLYTTIRNNGFQGNYTTGNWYSDPSNVSTTVSSTNSKRPLNGQNPKEDRIRTGLGTIHPILAVCYIFYHIPVVVLSIFPSLIYPWDVPLLGLWLGLLQDLLIPVSLGLIDSRFCEWVSKVYRCGERRKMQDKVPHVGLDGKFRHFGSQPQSLEITQIASRNVQPVEHKFPITNGSLYTSIDGRPFIHNYRRPKTTMQAKPSANTHPMHQQANMKCLQIRENLEAQQRCILKYQNAYDYTNIAAPQQCGSRTSLQFDPSLDTIRQNLAALRQKNSMRITPNNINANYVASDRIPDDFNVGMKRFSRTNLRLSKSQDSLNDIQTDLTKFKELVRSGNITKVMLNKEGSVLDSDEEFEDVTVDKSFDTLSSESSYSITTEANCDFEFYNNNSNDFDRMQTSRAADKLKITLPTSIEDSRAGISGSYLYLNDSKKVPSLQQTSLNYNYNQLVPTISNWNNSYNDSKPTTTKKSSRNNSLSDVSDLGYNFKIKRSNSKRSLENFQTYLDEASYTTVANFNNANRLQKANSFVSLEDKYKNNYVNSFQNHNSVKHEDFVSSFLVNNNKYSNNKTNYVGSVPDLKKVFISEYI